MIKKTQKNQCQSEFEKSYSVLRARYLGAETYQQHTKDLATTQWDRMLFYDNSAPGRQCSFTAIKNLIINYNNTKSLP